jgi:NDP-sugar pyrophosphorylase family protein
MRAMNGPDLSPAAFFELHASAHASLFEGLDRAWEALDGLSDHLDRLLAGHEGERLAGRVEEGATLIGDDILLGEGSVIEPGAYVKGPCVIGRNVEVRHGAYLRGKVLVADGCIVGHATEVKGSIFLEGAKAGHFAYVGDSVLGREVNLGAGTKLANLKLAGDEVLVRCGDERVPSGRRKFGAILGDGVQTGCNSVTNPGTMLGPRCLVHPCTVAGGFHAAGAFLR